jgi:acyl-CoA reductase-like NAD-dependent aldehyde dehydrogenase
MAELQAYWQNLIDGRWRDGARGRRLTVEDPATARPLAEIARAEPADADAAARAARRAFDGPWGELAPVRRAELVRAVGRELSGLAEEVALAECLDNGKRISAARGEATAAARYFDYYAGLVDKLEGRTIPLGPGYLDYLTYEPYGVTAHIVPWNFPLGIAARSLAPALAAGNTAVVKSPAVSPLGCCLLAEACQRAGLPEGVVNLICGPGRETGGALLDHPEVDHVVFTGSVPTGRRIMAAAARRVIPCVLELGGKSAGLVMADADPARTAADVAAAIFSHAGQICSAASRLIVDRPLYPAMLEALAAEAGRLSMGPGMEDHDLTPLISADHRDSVAAHCARALDDGIPALCGGRPPEGLAGHFFPATVFKDVPPDHPLAQEEIFGPVLAVTPCDGPEEAVALANGTDFGLVAGVYTGDLALAHWAAGRLRAGQVFVNQWFAGGVETPFGGWKRSGFGREKGREGLFNYLQTKNVAVRL